MHVVSSNLEAVTVHAEGALCTRIATVPSAGGMLPSQVRINGLPLSLQPGSLRASVVHGPSGLAVRDLRPTYDVQLPPEVDVPAEHLALEEAEHRLADVTQQLSRVSRELDDLSKLSPGFPPRPKEAAAPEPREAPVSALLSLMSFVDTELAALHSRKLALERQQRDAEAELRLRRSRVAEASSSERGQRARIYRAVVLTLSGPLPADQGAQLALEYAVQGARWVPTYDLRLPRTLEEGTLRMRASVLQRTGEDWTGVKLAVSTADLARQAEVPELKALRIGRHQPPPARSGWREAPPGLDELFAGYDATRPPTPAQPEPEPMPAFVEQPQKNKRSAMPMSPKADFDMETAALPPPAPAAAPRGAPMRPSAAVPSKEQVRSRGGMMPRASRPPAPAELDDAPGSAFEEAEDGLGMDAAPLGGGGGGADDRSAPRQEPSDTLLDYDRLSMSPADDLGARGRLQPRPRHATQELMALVEVHALVGITVQVALSQQETASVWAAPAPAWSQPPRTSSPHFDARFDVETRADVPSDGAWHTVPVVSVPVGLSAEYVCVPSVEPRVFRTVRVENRTPYPLLAGPVDVTLENEFLMTSPLPAMAPGSTQRLGLGVEESIKVARNTRFDEATGGMFGGSTMLTHHVSVELANRLGNRILVEVCERVPTVPASAEKDIKVEELEVAPPWQKRLPLPGEAKVEGERAWRVVLQPGEAQTLKATWTVKIPGNKMLGGGNRRT